MSATMRAAAGLAIVSFFVLAAILAPLVTPLSPDVIISERHTPPFWQEQGTLSHPLGTDHLGRDVLGRLAYGPRVSLMVALGALAISGLMLITLGLLFGYYRGPWDSIYNVDTPFPVTLALKVVWLVGCLFVALTVVSSLGSSLSYLIAAMVLATGPRYIGVIQRRVRRLAALSAITQAKERGTSDFVIFTRLLFPKIAHTLPGLLILQMGFLMTVEFILTFLGVGIYRPTPSWGGAVADHSEWWTWTFPLASIILLVAGFYMLGSWLLDRSEDKAF